MRLHIILVGVMLLAGPTLAHAQSAVQTDDASGPRFGRLIEWRDEFSAWRRTTGPLFPLYMSFAGLQLVDAHSTTRAIGRGETEANVLMRGLAGSPAVLTLVKASAAVSTIYLVEKVRRRSRVGAILTMVGLDSAYVTIVASNYRR